MQHQLTVRPPPEDAYFPSAYTHTSTRRIPPSHIRSRSTSAASTISSTPSLADSDHTLSSSRSASSSRASTIDASHTLRPHDYHRLRAQKKLAQLEAQKLHQKALTSAADEIARETNERRCRSMTRRHTILVASTRSASESAPIRASRPSFAASERSMSNSSLSPPSLSRSRSSSASSSSAASTTSEAISAASLQRSTSSKRKSVRFADEFKLEFADCATPEAPMPPVMLEVVTPGAGFGIEAWVREQREQVEWERERRAWVAGKMVENEESWEMAYALRQAVGVAEGLARGGWERGRRERRW